MNIPGAFSTGLSLSLVRSPHDVRGPVRVLRAGALAGTVLLSTLLPAPAAERDAAFEEITKVPSKLFEEKDAAGAAWTISRHGYIENSGNNLINQAQFLRIDGNDFRGEKALKGGDGTRWILSYSTPTLQVNRDIFFDRARGGVRYVDSFRNIGEEQIQTNVEYANSLRSSWLKLYTSQGHEFNERLGSRDTGIFVRMPEDRGNQGVFFLLSGERSTHKPGIVTDGSNKLNLRFTLSLAPREAKSIAYWVAQRTIVDPARIKELTAEFYRQQLMTDAFLSKDQRVSIVNFDLAGAPGSDVEPFNAELLVALNELTERLAVLRTGQDLLWVARESQLSGTLAGESVAVESRFGEFTIPVGDVAAIQGGGGRGRQQKLYLRDGTVLQSPLEIEGLRLSGNEGWDLDLDITQLEYLLGKVSANDGKTDEKTNLFVHLHSGDVCGVEVSAADTLDFMGPWGGMQVPMTRIRSMTYSKAPSPRCRLSLEDGSMITGFLVDRPVVLRSAFLGEIEVNTGEISGLWTKAGAVPEEEAGEREFEDLADVDFPACLLKGSNLVAGRLGNEQIHVVSGTTVTPLNSNEIVGMLRTYEEESELMPVFEIELRGGDVLVGTLREDKLSIVGEHVNWSVPVPHFLAMQVPPGE